MLETINARAANVGDAFFAASRQVWLAGLGAAVVTREWAGKEAGTVFRNLVREGTAVESRAFRFVGDRLDSSFTQANALWRRARHSVTSTVKTYTDTAATLVRESLPASLPGTPSRQARPVAKRPAKRARRSPPSGAATKRAKRTVKRAGKRG